MPAEIAAKLSELRDRSIIDELTHKSLSDIVENAARELKAIDTYFTEKLKNASPPIADDLLRSARSALVRALSGLCRHLSEFESSTWEHALKDEEAARSAFDWILGGLMAEIDKFARLIRADGWDITVSAGLPPNISISVTLSFS